MKVNLTVVLVLLLVASGVAEAGNGLVLLDIYPTIYPVLRKAPCRYEPQAGDMLVFVPGNAASRAFFGLTTGRPVSHVAVVVEVDGRMLVLSAEKNDGVVLEGLEFYLQRCCFGDVVWVRRLEKSLANEQKSRLADWAFQQKGKPYAYLNQLTTVPRKLPFVRGAFGAFLCERMEQPRWFCSQLVFTAYQVCGVADPRYRASSVDPGEMACAKGLGRPFCLTGLVVP